MKNITLFKSTNRPCDQGFSLVELIIVLLIFSILTVLTLMSLKGDKKFLADTEAYVIMDFMNEARQRALTQHETFRVEINKTTNKIRLIAENKAGDATDDREMRSVTLEHPNYVVYEKSPNNMASPPVDSSPVPEIVFKKSEHPTSAGNSVATLRFLQNGNVVDAGSNATGSNSVLTGATIYVWMPEYSESGNPLPKGSVIRAITVLSSTGTARYWKCEVAAGQCTDWKQQ